MVRQDNRILCHIVNKKFDQQQHIHQDYISLVQWFCLNICLQKKNVYLIIHCS